MADRLFLLAITYRTVYGGRGQLHHGAPGAGATNVARPVTWGDRRCGRCGRHCGDVEPRTRVRASLVSTRAYRDHAPMRMGGREPVRDGAAQKPVIDPRRRALSTGVYWRRLWFLSPAGVAAAIPRQQLQPNHKVRALHPQVIVARFRTRRRLPPRQAAVTRQRPSSLLARRERRTARTCPVGCADRVSAIPASGRADYNRIPRFTIEPQSEHTQHRAFD
jgi:hypothetical protein